MMCKCGVCVYFHRQLEAIIRISEALAKMSLSPFALDTHVDEALRLFQVSTLEAAHSGRLAGKWPWRWRMEWWVEFNKGIRWHLALNPTVLCRNCHFIAL